MERKSQVPGRPGTHHAACRAIPLEGLALELPACSMCQPHQKHQLEIKSVKQLTDLSWTDLDENLICPQVDVNWCTS